MSKTRGNAIALSATADQTAQLIKRAKTDAHRHITYEPETRPEVSNLVLLAALCQDRDPHQVAEDIGTGGSAALKQAVTEAVNEFLRPIRARRTEYATDRSYLRRLLAAGNDKANTIAEQTLAQVRTVMGTTTETEAPHPA
jgi:tryptophanyl-tRNA synthetase